MPFYKAASRKTPCACISKNILSWDSFQKNHHIWHNWVSKESRNFHFNQAAAALSYPEGSMLQHAIPRLLVSFHQGQDNPNPDIGDWSPTLYRGAVGSGYFLGQQQSFFIEDGNTGRFPVCWWLTSYPCTHEQHYLDLVGYKVEGRRGRVLGRI